MSMAPRSTADHLQPLRALRAVRDLIRDPEDTEQVFHIMDALRGRATRRNVLRMRRFSPTLLEGRDDMLGHLGDRAALAALPPDSLGRAYLAFCEREGITPEGLVEASEAAARPQAARGEGTERAEVWFERRGRDTHDLWHVVTGYGTQPLGEVCVVAFSFAQIHHAGFGVIALAGALKHAQEIGVRDAFRPVLEAIRHGRRAAWFPAQDWAALLPRPLDEVRDLLGVRQPCAYEDVLTRRSAVLA